MIRGHLSYTRVSTTLTDTTSLRSPAVLTPTFCTRLVDLVRSSGLNRARSRAPRGPD